MDDLCLFIDTAAGQLIAEFPALPFKGVHKIRFILSESCLIDDAAAVDHGKPAVALPGMQVTAQTEGAQKGSFFLRQDIVIHFAVERHQDQGILNGLPGHIAVQRSRIVSEKDRPLQRVPHPVDRIVLQILVNKGIGTALAPSVGNVKMGFNVLSESPGKLRGSPAVEMLAVIGIRLQI